MAPSPDLGCRSAFSYGAVPGPHRTWSASWLRSLATRGKACAPANSYRLRHDCQLNAAERRSPRSWSPVRFEFEGGASSKPE
uniref:Uncharacterized protein n=1 Tax=Oryza rufipogon TaxID=4529 RepID=A0A0E0ND05_ORYRU